MKSTTYVSGAIIILAVFIITGAYLYRTPEKTNPPATMIQLEVPSITQAPGDNWNDPWGNACEEASASMVQAFYAEKALSQDEANKTMQALFVWENEYLKKNADTNAVETKQMIEANTKIRITIKRKPTLEEIKKELQAKRPVIALVNQFALYNEPPTGIKGASFHVFVITGYNDTTNEFTVNDPARPTIKKYQYARIMKALHDLGESGEAEGEPTVLFTKL